MSSNASTIKTIKIQCRALARSTGYQCNTFTDGNLCKAHKTARLIAGTPTPSPMIFFPKPKCVDTVVKQTELLKEMYEREIAIASLCMCTKNDTILSIVKLIYPESFQDRLNMFLRFGCRIVAQSPYSVQLSVPSHCYLRARNDGYWNAWFANIDVYEAIPVLRSTCLTIYNVQVYWNQTNVPESWENNL
jgi:hypothetical protein